MNFTSYARNGEDALLWSVLDKSGGGRYVDVGAGDPVTGSVTYGFYRQGWRGLNTEPDPTRFARLNALRPDDLNLPVLVGETDGEAPCWTVVEAGLTVFDPELARQHVAAGWTVQPVRARTATLATLCRAYVQGPVDFLRVAGRAGPVLAGADWNACRPALVLLGPAEAAAGRDVAALLEAGGYRLAHADGENRFYAVAERLDRFAEAFARPNAPGERHAGVPDAARAGRDRARIDREVGRAELRIAQARADARVLIERAQRAGELAVAVRERELERKGERIEELHRAYLASEEHVRVLQGAIAKVYGSTTWKLGRPIRLAARLIQLGRRVRPSAVPAAPPPEPAPAITPVLAPAKDEEPEFEPAESRPPPAAFSMPAHPRATAQEAALLRRFRGEPHGF